MTTVSEGDREPDLTDIKPCACGGWAELRAGWAMWVECTKCDRQTDGFMLIGDAIKAWNARNYASIGKSQSNGRSE